MANEFYITAGLPAIDSVDSPPAGDNKFFITAGLVAIDYETGGAVEVLANTDNLVITENVADVNLNVSVQGSINELALTEYAASIKVDTNIQANLDSLVIVANVASVNVNINVDASTDTLLLSSFGATINAENNVLANIDTLIIATHNANVSVGGKYKTSVFESKIFHSHIG